MRLEAGYISLHDMRLRAFHGVLPQERVVGGDYSVDLNVKCELADAVATDDVNRTLNYADLAAVVEREMAVPSCLLEHVAGRIAKAVAALAPTIEEVVVRVTKLNPPMGIDCAGASVEIHLINDKTE